MLIFASEQVIPFRVSLFVYNLNETFTFGKEHIRSKSSNAAFLNQSLKGKIKGTYSQSTWFEL